MISKCKSCDKNINRNHPGLQCRGFCAKFFHANNECSDIGRNQAEIFSSVPGLMWICSACRSNSSSGGGDTSVSRRASLHAGSRPGHVDTTSVGNITEELKLLRESVTFCSDKISDFEIMIKNVTDYMKLTDKLKAENEQLKSELSSLSARLLLIEQTSRSNNIEIVGVPESKNENLFKIVQNIGCFIGYKIEDKTIDYIHRVPTKNSDDQPKNIVMRLTSKIFRDDILAAAKAKVRDNPNKRLILDGTSTPIYMNEHLTQENKIIYKEARVIAKEKHFKFVWVKNGKVFLRKDDRSKIILVKNVEVLKNI